MLRYGRRRAIAAQGLFFCLGPVIMAAAGGPGCGRAKPMQREWERGLRRCLETAAAPRPPPL
jgi:hypothetical protein